ncbi:MAG: hypothetical protein IT450_11325 [Phycisphaerales bacterium]|nr:hypothetical protein [Phycisphaerales bacterium]
MDSHEAPRSHNAAPAYRPRTTWRLRIGRLFLILAGLWLVLWAAGYGYFIATSGDMGGDPVLAHWIAIPVLPEVQIGFVATSSPLFLSGAIAPPTGLLVLFDVAPGGSSAYYSPNSTQRIAIVPAWTPPLILFGLACLLLIRWCKPAPNTCRSCGYNLTGNVSGRCPECGSPLHVSDAARR